MADDMNDLGYIAACESVGPNSPEFETVLTRCRRSLACQVLNDLRAKLFDALNEGRIDDENFNQLDWYLHKFEFE